MRMIHTRTTLASPSESPVFVVPQRTEFISESSVRRILGACVDPVEWDMRERREQGEEYKLKVQIRDDCVARGEKVNGRFGWPAPDQSNENENENENGETRHL